MKSKSVRVLKISLIIFQMSLLGGNKISAQSLNDTLWQKAVKIAEQNELWVPGTLLENEIVTDENGKVEETTKRHIQIRFGNDRGFSVKLISSNINGNDITKAEKNSFESDSNTSEYLQEDEPEIPFSPSLQKSIFVTRLSETQWLDSTECVVYQYRQKAEETDWQGTAWLEKITGIPLKIQFKTDKILKEEGAKIKNLTGTIFYKHDVREKWYPVKMQYKMRIAAKIFPFFTFRGHVENEILLEDYFLFEEREIRR